MIFSNFDIGGEKIFSTIEQGLLCIGDSYCEGYTPEGNISGWGIKLKQSLNTPNDIYFEYTSGGCGFTTNDNTYEMLVDKAIAEISEENKARIKNIVVAGGWGDKTVNTLITATCREVYQKLNNSFPNAKITYAFLAFFDSDKYKSLPLSTIALAHRLVEESAASAGFSVITRAWSVLYGIGSFASDGYHPTVEGQRKINCLLTSGINGNPIYCGGEAITNDGNKLPFNNNNGIISFNTLEIAKYFSGEENVTLNNSFLMLVDGFKNEMPLTSMQYVYIDCVAVFASGSSTPYSFLSLPATLRLGNKKIELQCVSAQGGNFTTINNLENIRIYLKHSVMFDSIN